MENTNLYKVGGFAFCDQAAMDQAKKEAEGIRYIKNRSDMKDPDVVYQIYCRMVEQKLFETQVGYAFLYELQEYLTATPYIKNEDIPAIPVAKIPIESPEHSSKTDRKPKRAVKKNDVTVERRGKNSNYKTRFGTSLTINIILLVIVAGMFAVTATSGNINIVNYENALIEKYEQWETRLQEREKKLDEREQNLIRQESAASLGTDTQM